MDEQNKAKQTGVRARRCDSQFDAFGVRNYFAFHEPPFPIARNVLRYFNHLTARWVAAADAALFEPHQTSAVR